MSEEQDPRRNPYAAPTSTPPPAPPHGPGGTSERLGLGAWLTGGLILQILSNVYLSVRFFTGTMVAVEPNAPAWSFPARGVFGLFLAGACGLILARRRIGWHAYLALCVGAVPLNIARGESPISAVAGAALAPVIVWLLLRKRMAALR